MSALQHWLGQTVKGVLIAAACIGGIDAGTVRDLSGTYGSNMFGIMHVRRAGNGAYLAQTDTGRYRLIEVQPGTYRVERRLLGRIPFGTSQMKSARFYRSGNDLMMREGGKTRRVAIGVTPRPIPSAWRRRVGTYVRTSGSRQKKLTKITAEIREGFFILKMHLGLMQTAPFILKILDDHRGVLVSPNPKYRKTFVAEGDRLVVRNSVFKKIR